LTVLVKIQEEIERLDKSEIIWNEVMLVDPRDYEPSEWNARKEERDRKIKWLTDSVLESGFRHPILVDENKKIIDGVRRWLIALEYGLKIPAIHRRYGSGKEADFKRAIDSILANMTAPNYTKELGIIINELRRLGYSSSFIARHLGKSTSQINQWSAIDRAPEELIPEGDEEAQEIYAGMTEGQRQAYTTLVKSKDMPAEEKAKTLRAIAKMTGRRAKEIVSDLKEGLEVDLEREEKIKQIKISKLEARVPTHQLKEWKKKLKLRKWDKTRTLMAFFNLWIAGQIDINPKEYDMYGRDDYGLEENSS